MRSVAAELYPTEAAQRRIVTEAGLRAAAIPFDPSADNSWHAILDYANTRGEIESIANRIFEENEHNELLRQIREDRALVRPRSPQFGRDLAWKGADGGRSRHEKLTGATSALVSVSFLTLGLRAAQAVVKIVVPGGDGGSGFLIDDGRIVTNNHVLVDESAAASAFALFNYQEEPDGTASKTEQVAFKPERFFRASEEDDWTVVALDAEIGGTNGLDTRWPPLSLKSSTVKVGERVNIIQHPGGGPKQLSFFANTIEFVGSGRLQYLTDTMPGSSGAPVFDRHWRVVGIHHSGGWVMEPGSETVGPFFRNEGILIERVISGLSSAK